MLRRQVSHFSLVLLDYLMPDIDGFELAERINKDPSFLVVTMIMLTSAGQRGDARRCMNVGITAYCLKPIKQSELFAIYFHGSKQIIRR